MAYFRINDCHDGKTLKSWIAVGKEKNNDNGKPKYSFQFNLGGTADHEECGSGNSQG